MELQSYFENWTHQAGGRYKNAQWMLSKWEVTEGIVWPEEKIAGMVETIKAGLRIGPEHELVDMGCGGGWIAERLRPCCRKVTGLDFSQEMLAIAARGNSHSWVEGKIGDLPFKSNSLDRALSYFVFLNFEDDSFVEAAIFDIIRTLKVGGVALIGQLPDKAMSKKYDEEKRAYLDFCQKVMPVGERNDEGTRAPLRLFDQEHLGRMLEGKDVRHEFRPSFNPFFRPGVSLTAPFRFDLVIFKD